MYYKSVVSQKDRIKESTGICNKYPGKIPIIAESHKNFNTQSTQIFKYIAKPRNTVSKLLKTIKSSLSDVDASATLFLFINNINITITNTTIKELYDKYKDDDGFLYVEYTNINALG